MAQMSAWLTIAVRFGLYLDLMLLFGVSLFGLCAFRRDERASVADIRLRTLLAALAGLGLAFSLVALAVMAKAMSGAEDLEAIEQHVYEMIIMQTDVGVAWLVRMAVLAIAICAAGLLRRFPTLSLSVIAAMAAGALSSLAWAGHGAMDAGTRGYVHLSADILHLAAAAMWVGALAIFVLLSARSTFSAWTQVKLLSRVLNGFASMGTLIVASLVITGLANYWLINGASFDGLTSTVYGRLMLMKLSLFAFMLGLATANRYRLSPRLEAAIRAGSVSGAVVALRRSLVIEFTAATLILALVSWLGTLSPNTAIS
jgi:putative copper resistance protein D